MALAIDMNYESNRIKSAFSLATSQPLPMQMPTSALFKEIPSEIEWPAIPTIPPF